MDILRYCAAYLLGYLVKYLLKPVRKMKIVLFMGGLCLNEILCVLGRNSMSFSCSVIHSSSQCRLVRAAHQKGANIILIQVCNPKTKTL